MATLQPLIHQALRLISMHPHRCMTERVPHSGIPDPCEGNSG